LIPGFGVVIARRVCDLAATDELLASRTVKDLVPGSGIAFADRGVHTFREHVRDDRSAACLLLTLAGLRRSEVLGLRWSDVDFASGKITIAQGRVVVAGRGTVTGGPKSRRSGRALPMPSDVIAALRAFKACQAEERLALGPGWAETGLVAVNADGSPIRPETYSKTFATHCAAAGVPVIRLLDGGTTPSATAKWLGHNPAITLRVYGHVYDDALASAGHALLGRSRAKSDG
jgi:integrase